MSRVYPRDREAEVALRDGSTVHVRPVREDDAPAIRRFLEGVSSDSLGFRFFGFPSLDWVTRWSVDVDYAERFALVAETGSPRQIIAHAAYVGVDGPRAEVAFLVADAWQGRGIATVLLAHLAEVAERHGITTFSAEVLPTNHRMISVFRESGFAVRVRPGRDAITIEMPASVSPAARERFEDRDRAAAVAAVRSVLEPRTVAVIGASRRRGTVGGEVLHNLLEASFTGTVYAVNPRASVVQSVPAHHSITEIPEPVDLAVIVVPAPAVVRVARDCARAGVRALLVISAGFAETGPEGAARQRELVAVCRASGMRLVGPNCLGALNTAPGVSLNATFAPHAPARGGLSFMSQSGGLGIAIMELAQRLGSGLASFVSVGNKADLSGNDFLSYWEQDDTTRVGLLYLESFGNPRKFARIAPRFARRKPLVAVKSGRTAAGARGTSSHTGALLAASEVTVDALFEQAGVIRTDTLHELLGVGAFLDAQPVPAGDRVAIVTNAGGPGILCADACQAAGVDVPAFDPELRSRLAAVLAPGAGTANPVDMLATASAEQYRRALQALIASGACDAILVIFVPPLVTRAEDVAAAIAAVAAQRPPVPIATVFMTAEGAPAQLGAGAVRVPAFAFPEDAARAIALAARYGRWRAHPRTPAPMPGGTDADRAAAVLSRELSAAHGWLDPSSVAELLTCYGLPLVASRFVTTAAAAEQAAAELGMPVVVKGHAAGLVHKRDAGAVRLGLDSPAAVRRAVGEIGAALDASGQALEGLIVQPMIADGVELIVGVVNDHSFGPVLACGAGGTNAELLGDVTVRITPLTEDDPGAMLRSLRTYPLLEGYRGSAACDRPAIEDIIRRVGAMVESHPEIEELDLNPVIAGPHGAVIVDARVRLAPAPPPVPMPSLAST